MLIDDNPIDLLVNRRVIESAFLEEVHIIQKQSGEEALNYLRQVRQWPDYILLDIKMPSMTGFEFLEELQQLEPCQSKIIMVTSSIDPEDIAVASRYLPVKGFISKPLAVNQLREQMEK